VQFAAGVFWGNFIGIAVFAGLVVAAILLRRKPQAHKRLMLLASIALVGPALARISRWSVFGGEDGPFVPIVFLGLLAVLIAYDIVSARRPHRATLIGCGGIVLALIAAQLIAQSEFGMSVVRMIG
jgi:ABC-type enterochelin transport system permease subunit